MHKRPFISVIINNYNYARFLPAAIQSVLDQEDFTDYEIIVVDDASLDHSQAVLKSYGNKISCIFHYKNQGQGAAFYSGLQASQGEWICFLDADDLFEKNKLVHVAKKAEQNPDALLIYHLGYYVDETTKSFAKPFPSRTYRDGNIKKHILSTGETLLPPTSFLTFKRSFLEKILPMDPFLSRIDADFPLQVMAGIMGKIVSIKKPLGFYRLHGNNWYSNDDFLKLSQETLLQITRRTEKSYYHINRLLKQHGMKERIDLLNHRFYRRNLYIFNHLSVWKLLFYPWFHPNFEGWMDKWNYLAFGLRRRRMYLNSEQ